MALTGVALSMDALAVSVSCGLNSTHLGTRPALRVGGCFGGFQAAMPALGGLVFLPFQKVIGGIDHWIAFILLAIMGGKMIKDSVSSHDDDQKIDANMPLKTLLTLGVATSIDAMAAGFALPTMIKQMPLLVACVLIGCITFIISVLGVIFGRKLGRFAEAHVGVLGGTILIAIGINILLEHTGLK